MFAVMPRAAKPRTWIFPSNPHTFDADEAFRAVREVTWSETTARTAVGDTVYLYGSSPVRAIIHQCEVTETGLPLDLDGADAPFWVFDARDERSTRTWMRLRHVREFSERERASLSFARLTENGLSAAPQGRVLAKDGVLALIERVITRSDAVSDAVAEVADYDETERAAFERAINGGDYSAPDGLRMSKTRGSAQRAFADAVKQNYGYRCAVTGIRTRQFLVASHIVPWADDETIRLDPTNGICLSTMVDRAFDMGFLDITDDFRVSVKKAMIKTDAALAEALLPFDGQALDLPSHGRPSLDHLQRRRTRNASLAV